MNDRYLYRAKSTDNGEWVEGYYALIGNKHVIISKESEGYYTEFVEERHGYEIVNVDPLTACQCTGLKDKNGKLIWENDIVRDKYMKYRVIWCDKEGSWMLQSASGAMYGIGSINSKKYEVVGNIFDEGSENIGKGAEEN